MKTKKSLILLISFIFLLIALISIYLFSHIRKDSSPASKNEEQEIYNVEEVYEAFIEEEEYSPEVLIEREEKEVEMSAWIPYWDLNRALTTTRNHPASFKSVSPTWYYVMADGTLGLKNTARNEELRDLCKEKDINLLPSISNSNADELSNILNNSEVLSKHIENIVNEARTYNYDGIDIDYEMINSTDKDNFTNFVQLLSEKLHKENKLLTIAILWKYEPVALVEEFSESRAAQDWSQISNSADEFRIMAYDYTKSSNSDGPISPSNWIRSILDYALDAVENHDKIVLGLPLYAYEWLEGTSGANALVYSDVVNIKSSYSIISDSLIKDRNEKKLVYEKNNSTMIIWYQDKEVTDKRIDLAKSYGIFKFVFWRLGGEDTRIFSEQED